VTTTQALKAVLQSALAEYLGIYRFSGNLTTPAIRIEDRSDPYPEEPTVTGLELVIVPPVGGDYRQLLGGFQDGRRTLILLKQWDSDQTTEQGRDVLLAALLQLDDLGIERAVTTPRSGLFDDLETLRVEVTQQLWQERPI